MIPQRIVAWLLIPVVAVGPMLGCGSSATDNEEAVSQVDRASTWAANAWTATRDATTGAWSVVSDKSAETWTVMMEHAANGSSAAWDASKSAMLWSKDRTIDGWDWIAANVSAATEWASDTTNRMWLITRKSSGEFYLWVKVEVGDGVAYVRTAVPQAWEVTKDAGGKAWVWVNDHKVEATVAASVVALVVTGLVVEPVTTSTLLARGAITRAGAEFLSKIYYQHQSELNGMTEEEFVAIGTEVLEQNGDNASQTGQAASAP